MTSLGEHVAALRLQRGLSQRELAAAVNRSESWVSQVERGVIAVERIPVLQALADALHVSVADLNANHRDDSEPPTRSDMEGLRLALTGHPAPTQLLMTESARTVDQTRLPQRLDAVWAALHAANYVEFSCQLAPLLPELERARRVCSSERRAELDSLTARAYQAAAAGFARVDEADASWVAADRAVLIAEQAGDPLLAFAGLFRMAHAFITLGRFEQAEATTVSGISALDERNDPSPEALSVRGALYLALAVTHAKAGERAPANNAIAKAHEIAETLGEDRNDYGTEFGPTNVALHAVSVAVELGDAGQAVELATSINPDRLSAERQSRYWLDVARAHGQRRHTGDAIAALLRADELAPEQLRTHQLARDLIRDLLATTGRRPPAELVELSKRCAAS